MDVELKAAEVVPEIFDEVLDEPNDFTEAVLDADFLTEPEEPSSVAATEHLASVPETFAPVDFACDDCGSLTIESEPALQNPKVAEAVTPEMWLPISEIIKTQQFRKLRRLEAELAVAFWKTGDTVAATRLIANESKWSDEPFTAAVIAKLLEERFDRPDLGAVVDMMTGKASRDKFLEILSRAVRDHRTSRAQIEALRLQGEVLGLLPKE